MKTGGFTQAASDMSHQKVKNDRFKTMLHEDQGEEDSKLDVAVMSSKACQQILMTNFILIPRHKAIKAL